MILSSDLAAVRCLDVVLVRGQGYRCKDANDGDDDHELYERKAAVVLGRHIKS
jgi:hypothetical protein